MSAKENDLFLNRLFNPDMSISDFEEVGLSAINTSLESEESYQNNEQIRNNPLFQTNGTYDSVKLHNFYTETLGDYNQLAKDSHYNDLTKSPIFYKDDLFAPRERRNQNYETDVRFVPNPFGHLYGTQGLNSFVESPFSQRERGQQNNVLLNPEEVDFENGDFSNAKWGKSLNEMSLFNSPMDFFKNFADTQILSKWHEDGEHINPITGVKEKHRKGDLRIDSSGNFFYENLNGREVYGEEVMSKWDNLTVDGTLLNSFDVFDSDDKEKSLTGTIVREALEIIPMFCPYVGPVYIGSRILLQFGSVMTTLAQMGVDQSDSESPILSKLQGLNESLSVSRSDNAMNNPWALENIIVMAGDVVRQLTEQRFLFDQSARIFGNAALATEEGQIARRGEIAQQYIKENLGLTKPGEYTEKLFKTTIEKNVTPATMQELSLMAQSAAKKATQAEIEAMHRWGENMAKVYMTGITVADAYGEAKMAGASDTEAALLTLGYAAGEWAILSTDIGKWILTDLRAEKGLMRATGEKLMEAGVLKGQAQEAISQQEKLSLARRLINAGINTGKKIAHAEYTVKGTGAEMAKNVVANALGEGVEETSEELLYDVVKSMGNLAAWMTGSDTRYDAFDNWGLRYSQSFLGGLFGGAIAQMNPDYLKSLKSYSDMTFEQALQNAVWLIGEGKKQDLIKVIQELPIDSKFLSTKGLEYDPNGFMVRKPGNDVDNMDKASKQILIDTINLIDDIINTEAASISSSSLLYGHFEVLKELRISKLLQSVAGEDGTFNQTKVGSIGNYLQEFNNARTEFVRESLNLYTLTHPSGVVTTKMNEYMANNKAKITEAEGKVKEAKKKLDEYLQHKKAPEFITTLLKELSSDYIAPYLATNEILYAELNSGQNYDKLTKDERIKYHKAWETFKRSATYKDKLRAINTLSTNITKIWSPILTNLGEVYFKNQGASYIPKLREWINARSAIMEYLALNKQGDWVSRFKEGFNALFGKENYEQLFSLTDSPQVTLLLTLGGDEAAQFLDEELATLQDLPDLSELEDPTSTLIDQVIRGEYSLSSEEQPDVEQAREDIKKAEDEEAEELSLLAQNKQEVQNKLDQVNQELQAFSEENLSPEDQQKKDALTAIQEQLTAELAGLTEAAIQKRKEDKLRSINATLKTLVKNFVYGTELQVRSNILAKLDEYLNDIDGLFAPIVNQGYIHPELRDAVTSLLNQMSLELRDEDIFGDPVLEYRKNKIESYKKAIKDLPAAPILSVLDTLQLSISNPTMRISKLLQIANEMMLGRTLDNIELGNDTIEAIDSALLFFDLLDSELLGASTDAIGTGSVTGNPFGLFATINEIERKFGVEDKTNAPELPSDVAARIKEDYYPIKAKLQVLKTISGINNSQKLEEQNKVAGRFYSIITKRISTRILGHKDRWQEWDVVPEGKTVGVLTALENAVNEAETIKVLQSSPNMRVNLETRKKLEAERTKIEDAIYDLFKANQDKDLSKILSYENFNYYDSEEGLLTATSQDSDISDLHFIYWLMSKALVKTSSFAKVYDQALANSKIAPLAGQEIATHIMYSMIVNGDLATKWLKAIQKAATEANSAPIKETQWSGDTTKMPDIKMPADAVNVVRYLNCFLMEGVAGAGKTTLMQLLTSMLQVTPDGNSLLDNIWFAHISEERAKEFANDTGIKDNFKAFSRSSLLLKISDYELEKQKFKNANSQDIIVYPILNKGEDGIYRIPYNLKAVGISENLPKIIVIDEIGRYSSMELDIIDQFAQEHGITVICLGDLGQTRTKAEPEGGKVAEQTQDTESYSASLFRGNFCHSPKLGVPIRPNNEYKKKNQEYLEARALDIKKELQHKLRGNPYEGSHEFLYYQDDTGIYGDMVDTMSTVNNSSTLSESEIERLLGKNIISTIELMVATLEKSTDPEKPNKIGYAFYDRNSLLYQYLTRTEKGKQLLPYIDFRENNSAQGDEAQYFIIEDHKEALAAGLQGVDTFVEDLYTGITRSKQGSLLLISSQTVESIYDGVPAIVSTRQNNKQTLELNQEQIQQSIQERRNIIKDIVPEDTPLPVIVKRAKISTTVGSTKPDETNQELAAQQQDEEGHVYYDRPLKDAPETLARRSVAGSAPARDVNINAVEEGGEQEEEAELFLYSFNCFEIGWETTDHGYQPSRDPSVKNRIDGLYGLSKLYGARVRTGLTGDRVDEAISAIHKVRNAAHYKANKEDIIQALRQIKIGDEKIFDKEGLDIEFIYEKVYPKSSKDEESSTPPPAEVMPTEKEQILNVHNFDSNGKEIESNASNARRKEPLKQKVYIAVKTKDGYIFKTPIMTLPNIMTVIHARAFNQFESIWQASNGNLNAFINELSQHTDPKSPTYIKGARTLLRLGLLWTKQSPYTAVILNSPNVMGSNWVPMQSFAPTGMLLDAKSKGSVGVIQSIQETNKYRKATGFATQEQEEGKKKNKSWFVPTEVYAKNKGLVMSPYNISHRGIYEVDNIAVHFAKRGVPFVLYTDLDEIPPENLADAYLEQIKDYIQYLKASGISLPTNEAFDLTAVPFQRIPPQFKRIKLMYIVPPLASVEDFIKNEMRILNGDEKNEEYSAIGVNFDLHRILSIPGVMDLFDPEGDNFKEIATSRLTAQEKANYKATDLDKTRFKIVQAILSDIAGIYDELAEQLQDVPATSNVLPASKIDVVQSHHARIRQILHGDGSKYFSDPQLNPLGDAIAPPSAAQWPVKAFLRKFLIDNLAMQDIIPGEKPTMSKYYIKSRTQLDKLIKVLKDNGIEGIPYNPIVQPSDEKSRVIAPLIAQSGYTINGKPDSTVLYGNATPMLIKIWDYIRAGNNDADIVLGKKKVVNVPKPHETFVAGLNGLSNDVKSSLLEYFETHPDVTPNEDAVRQWAESEKRQYIKFNGTKTWMFIGNKNKEAFKVAPENITVTKEFDDHIEFTINLQNVRINTENVTVTCTYKGAYIFGSSNIQLDPQEEATVAPDVNKIDNPLVQQAFVRENVDSILDMLYKTLHGMEAVATSPEAYMDMYQTGRQFAPFKNLATRLGITSSTFDREAVKNALLTRFVDPSDNKVNWTVIKSLYMALNNIKTTLTELSQKDEWDKITILQPGQEKTTCITLSIS